MRRKGYIIEASAIREYAKNGLSPRTQLEGSRLVAHFVNTLQNSTPILGKSGETLYISKNGTKGVTASEVGYPRHIIKYYRYNEASKLGLLPTEF